MPRVAILTAARIDTPEKDNWLGEAIRSVQNQEFTDWEMIIVDDASPIPVPPSGDPRVRLVRASHQQGPAMCRNTAVGLARAEAILPLDADDQLASPDVLGAMLDQWEQDQSTIIYGDMRYLENGVLGKLLKFPEYDFTKILDPKGVIPVTAMHSRACWEAAGGWKPELKEGLEDVEYWIAAGAAGFCGVKIDLMTLIYRRGYPESRTRRMRAARLEGQARNLIREMHAELYSGRLPMGCCGSGKSRPVGPKTAPSRMMSAPRALTGADAPTQYTTIWVRYNGRREGQFGVRGQATGVVYHIDGRGSEFEIYTVDANIFRRSGRGQDFSVGIAPPAPESEPEPEPQSVPEFKAPPPQMAQINELDAVAREEAGIAPVPAPVPSTGQAATPRPVLVQPPPPLVGASRVDLTGGPPPLPSVDDLAVQTADTGLTELDIAIAQEQEKDHPLEELNLGRFQEMLEHEGWTIPGLAAAGAGELTPYPGIGQVTAENIVKKAQGHQEGLHG